jgi:hypothetical protein
LRLILGILFFGLTLNLFGQDKVLKDFDFDTHEYKFFFFYQDNEIRYEDSLPLIKPFVISDKSKLTDLKNDWIATNEVEGMLWCGYDYVIYVIENDTIIGHLNVNTQCGQVMVYGIGTSYDFKEYNPFEKLVGDADIYDTVLRADTITDARELYNKILISDSIYYPSVNSQEHLDFNGQFYFYVYKKDTVNGIMHFKDVEKEIYKRFPNDNILVDFWGFDSKRYDGYILCDSTFFWSVKNDIPIWDNFKFRVPDRSKWEPWAEINSKKTFSAFIFTDNKKKLSELIKNTAGNTR